MAVRSDKYYRTPANVTWVGMRARCNNPTTRHYDRYGGRGIKVCDRWQTFKNFLADMGERPPGKSLDRIDNDGDYEPGNCRWATRIEQRRNRGDVKKVTLNGITLPMIDWAERLGITWSTVLARLRRGATPERALAPVKVAPGQDMGRRLTPEQVAEIRDPANQTREDAKRLALKFGFHVEAIRRVRSGQTYARRK
jgi:hypothetical protein